MRQVVAIAALAAALSLAAQETVLGVPRIDAIDFYGLHQVSKELILQALGIKVGSPLPTSKGDAEDRLLDVDRIIGAHLEAVCCNEGKTTLYIGIQERDAPLFETRPAPGGKVGLPDTILSAYRSFEQARHAAELGGKTGEDWSQGHPLMIDPPARAAQMRFPALVQMNLGVIRDVLNNSEDEYQRGIATYLLPYATDKAGVVEDLHTALTDDDSGVRAKALHGLVGLALLGRSNPASRVRVPSIWFVDLLQSLAWTDRTQAVWALETLTIQRDKATLASLKGDALDSIIEMSRWGSQKDAFPAFLLVGRIAGMDDVDVRDAWLRNGRETTIEKARAVNK
jgi:hypothetical protein